MPMPMPMIDGIDYSQRYFEDVHPGDELPRVEDLITYRRVIMNPATTWDYFPGHHDPAYARAQGQPTIYVNTMHFLGFIDRLISEWAGATVVPGPPEGVDADVDLCGRHHGGKWPCARHPTRRIGPGRALSRRPRVDGR